MTTFDKTNEGRRVELIHTDDPYTKLHPRRSGSEKTTAYGYMVGLLLVLQDYHEKAKEKSGFLDKALIALKPLEEAQDINASNLYTKLEGMRSSYDIANLHNEHAQKRIASIMEALKKKEAVTGSKGTYEFCLVHKGMETQHSIKWDDGSSLMLLEGKDRFKFVDEEKANGT
ncbi:hypothetical protein LCGC14_1090570 [marine sediment metagenome]|uniref:Uncharacterized protein n=1 Tax=marine sediment metagenome TaxID=412755 RepID=A0A0F9N029_9ZZZZ